MTCEFQLTAQERKAAFEAALKRAKRNGARLTRIRPWVLVLLILGFIAIPIIGGFLQSPPSRTTPPPPSDPTTWRDIASAVLPWLILIAVGWFFVFKSRRGADIWEDEPTPRRMTANEMGLEFEDNFTRRELKWGAFWDHEETDALFVLYSGSPTAKMVHYDAVPKRAFVPANQLQAFRIMLDSKIVRRGSAFEVIPKAVINAGTPAN